MDIRAEVKDVQEDGDDAEDDWIPSLGDVKHKQLEFNSLSEEEMVVRAKEYYKLLEGRRTVRSFSSRSVSKEVIRNIIKSAGTAPSGAHTEPWTYVVVSSAEIKEQIRYIIEEEEEINYKKRMGKVWTGDLKPFRTNWIKPYLTEAPYLILAFKQTHSLRADGKKKMHYYSEQSLCISVGLLISAIHYAGLVSLTSTPLNCGPALRSLLGRPMSEKLAILLPVGYPHEDCEVPDLKRKPLDEIMVEFD
ncbi:PREDICTED: iodotyrosine deiodinase 1 isoform X2 [Nicrophorus vespilloides]|nr:PREDICTED: iodotyrosine deiodinase 1 isoform X2 [Nicrophorus vespilloides]